MFEYRLTQKPAASKKVKGLKTIQDRYAHALTEALNTEAKSGWEFVGQENFTVEDKAGIMKKSKFTDLTFLVFRREIAGEAVPLDQKLEEIKKKRANKFARARSPERTPAVPTAAAIPVEEPTVVTPDEPFPEPMPVYKPEKPVVKSSAEAAEIDVSRSLPFPGPTPARTMDKPGGTGAIPLDSVGPTLNYNHANGSKGQSVDAPILGPARRG